MSVSVWMSVYLRNPNFTTFCVNIALSYLGGIAISYVHVIVVL